MILSILIPTINGREYFFNRLMDILKPQLVDGVEIIYAKDNKEMPIGTKRKKLLEQAKGEYVFWADDDDTVPAYYIAEVMKALEQNPDCVCYFESVVIDGKSMIACHSTRFADWANNVGSYDFVRTPYFKDVIKRDIALAVGIPETRFGEDHEFSRRLMASKLLQKEVFIDKIMYNYSCYTMTTDQHNERYGIGNDDTIFITHNAGFFSCCSIALMEIMIWFNNNKRLPGKVNREAQYGFYKAKEPDNLIPYYFADKKPRIEYAGDVQITSSKDDFQYSDYRLINFDGISHFLHYFTPSDKVWGIFHGYENKYAIDYDNTCAVFYRGNDKNRETKIAPYSEFIGKAREVLANEPNIKFLVQPDETEFLEAFIAEFGQDRVIAFEETPHMRKQDSAVFFEMPQHLRAEYGAKFFAAVLVLSQCKHLIVHSGNGGFWSVLYRGNANNVYQWLNDKWL